MANCKDIIAKSATLTEIKDKSGVKITTKNCEKKTFDEIKTLIAANNKSRSNNKEVAVPDELLMAIACKESGGLKDVTTKKILFNLCAYTDSSNSSATGLMGITKTAIKDTKEFGFITDSETVDEIHAKLCNDAGYSIEIASLILQRKFQIARARKKIKKSDLSTLSDEQMEELWDITVTSYGTGSTYSKNRRSERDLLIENYTEKTAQGFSWG